MLYLGALIALLAILYIVVGNRRYPGHPASEWTTPGQKILIWTGIFLGLAIIIWKG